MATEHLNYEDGEYIMFRELRPADLPNRPLINQGAYAPLVPGVGSLYL